jgi:TolB-like protein
MLLVATSVTFTQEKPTVVIVPFDTVDVDKNEANVLFEVFTSNFAGLGKTRVVDRNSFDKIKAQHAFQTSDWSNSDKVAQLGKALNANLVVVGQLMSFKGSLVATFRMLDVNTVEIIATATERTSGTDELYGKLESMAKKLTANLNASSVKTSYNIGDEGPGGGIVFYYSEEEFDVYQADGSIKRCNYLEVSKMEVANVSWCSKKSDSDCCYINTNTELGFGKMNTYKIINGEHSGGTVSSSNCAAKACFEYSTAQTAKGEWFLPSKDELNLLYKNLGTRILVTATEGYHCASSQYSNDGMWVQLFRDGYQYGNIKDVPNSVRAIRAF